MPELHMDASYGLGGDMLLAGLLNLAGGGQACRELTEMLEPAAMGISVELVSIHRSHILGVGLAIEAAREQPLRTLPDLLAILEALDVSDRVRNRSRAAFEKLAQVEAGVHGMSVDEVHFHEVGAVDTLVDIVGSIWALERLGIEGVTCSSLPWFTGTVACAHGDMSLPAPATLALLRGKPVHPTDFTSEMITPTGALLLDQLVTDYVSGPNGVISDVSLSYGQRDTGGGLRLMLVDSQDKDVVDECVEQVAILESNVDHLTGEELGAFFQAIMEAGALDVLFTPGVMKKNRPGGQLQVMCRPDELPKMQETFFRHSLTLGIRRTLCERVTLKRKPTTMDTRLGELEGKCFELDGEEMERPEFEALQQLARKTGRSVAQLRLMLGAQAPRPGRRR